MAHPLHAPSPAPLRGSASPRLPAWPSSTGAGVCRGACPAGRQAGPGETPPSAATPVPALRETPGRGWVLSGHRCQDPLPSPSQAQPVGAAPTLPWLSTWLPTPGSTTALPGLQGGFASSTLTPLLSHITKAEPPHRRCPAGQDQALTHPAQPRCSPPVPVCSESAAASLLLVAPSSAPALGPPNRNLGISFTSRTRAPRAGLLGGPGGQGRWGCQEGQPPQPPDAELSPARGLGPPRYPPLWLG